MLQHFASLSLWELWILSIVILQKPIFSRFELEVILICSNADIVAWKSLVAHFWNALYSEEYREWKDTSSKPSEKHSSTASRNNGIKLGEDMQEMDSVRWEMSLLASTGWRSRLDSWTYSATDKLNDLVNEQEQFLEIRISSKYVETVVNYLFRGGEQRYMETFLHPVTTTYYKDRTTVLLNNYDPPETYIERYVLTRE